VYSRENDFAELFHNTMTGFLLDTEQKNRSK
jgi:hypothetical protein